VIAISLPPPNGEEGMMSFDVKPRPLHAKDQGAVAVRVCQKNRFQSEKLPETKPTAAIKTR
jgi:hypothetical protein